MKLISIIIPVFNEQSNIMLLLDKINSIKDTKLYFFEIIFINDGSRDNTQIILEQVCDPRERIFFINLSRNFGQQNALMAGYRFCNGEAAICMDADLQNPAELIPNMLELWESGYNAVVCKRRAGKQRAGILKDISSKIFYRFLRFASETEIECNTPDFRLIDRTLINIIKELPETDLFLRGIISWLGFKKAILEYDHCSRLYGKTSYSYTKMLNLAVTAVTGFSVKPLSLAVYIGLFMSVVSALYIFYAIIVYFVGHTISGWASTIVTISLFGGLQLFVLGIIGVYIGKIFKQIKGRPAFIVEGTNIRTTIDSSGTPPVNAALAENEIALYSLGSK